MLILMLSLTGSALSVEPSEEPVPVYIPEPVKVSRVVPTPIPTPEPTPEPVPKYDYTDEEIDMISIAVYGEMGAGAPEEQALVAWTIFQRVDDPMFPDTITEVVTVDQFHGYVPGLFPVTPEIRAMVAEEIEKWAYGEEPPTHEIYAPDVPYLYFDGDGWHNRFRGKY